MHSPRAPKVITLNSAAGAAAPPAVRGAAAPTPGAVHDTACRGSGSGESGVGGAPAERGSAATPPHTASHTSTKAMNCHARPIMAIRDCESPHGAVIGGDVHREATQMRSPLSRTSSPQTFAPAKDSKSTMARSFSFKALILAVAVALFMVISVSASMPTAAGGPTEAAAPEEGPARGLLGEGIYHSRSQYALRGASPNATAPETTCPSDPCSCCPKTGPRCPCREYGWSAFYSPGRKPRPGMAP